MHPAHQYAPLVTLPQEILHHVALALVFTDPYGIPAALTPLLSTCQRIYNALTSNSSLYAAIFRAMFDIHAAFRRHEFDVHASRRRYGTRALASSNLAAQLRVHCDTIRRIRQGDIYSPALLEDFKIAFVMMSENDGRNKIQLERAGLHNLLEHWIRARLWERHAPHDWPSDSPVNAFGLWLMWFMTDEARVTMEPSFLRQEIMDLVRPFVLLPCRYPAFYLPDNHLSVPISDNEFGVTGPPHSTVTPHGPWPVYRDMDQTANAVPHYGELIDIATPVIAPAALLIHFTRREVDPIGIPPDLPANRAHAEMLGRPEPSATVEDIVEFRNRHTVFPPLPDFDWRERLTPEQLAIEDEGKMRPDLVSLSSKLDNDWCRWTGCWDFYQTPTWKGPVFTPGSLAGLWQGRMLYPAEQQYRMMVIANDMPEAFGDRWPFVTNAPLYMRLREHHCINPDLPANIGGHSDGFDDGVLNAWLPECRFVERDGVVEVRETEQDVVAVYETYEPGQLNSHDPEDCKACTARLHRERQRARERVAEELAMVEQDFAMAGLPYDADDVEDMDITEDRSADGSDPEVYRDFDFVDQRCTGIEDVIVTGETDSRHGRAWGHYTFHGRVRSWDGLICIVRVPRNTSFGRFVFRGYLVGGQNFVGYWRMPQSDVGSVPWEGAFTMSRRAD